MVSSRGQVTHMDLSMSLPSEDLGAFQDFLKALREESSQLGLKCLLIQDKNLKETLSAIREGSLVPGYHLDYFSLWDVPGDPFAELSQAIQDAGGTPVNPPARARTFTDKSTGHGELARHGLGLPPTLILRPGMEQKQVPAMVSRFLTKSNPTSPGSLFLKKANGFASKGVSQLKTRCPQELAGVIRAVMEKDPLDGYLLQEEVKCEFLETAEGYSRPAYWRIIHCLGEMFAFWWKPAEYCGGGEASYLPLQASEILRYGLSPVLQYARQLQEISGLDWFSTELCLGQQWMESRYRVATARGETKPVISIDYFNDQCDVNVQSRWHGSPPDATVRAIAKKFARKAYQLKKPQGLAVAA